MQFLFNLNLEIKIVYLNFTFINKEIESTLTKHFLKKKIIYILKYVLFQVNAVLSILFIKEAWKKYHTFHKKFSTLIRRNVSWAPNQHIIMISE